MLFSRFVCRLVSSLMVSGGFVLVLCLFGFLLVVFIGFSVCYVWW